MILARSGDHKFITESQCYNWDKEFERCGFFFFLPGREGLLTKSCYCYIMGNVGHFCGLAHTREVRTSRRLLLFYYLLPVPQFNRNFMLNHWRKHFFSRNVEIMNVIYALEDKKCLNLISRLP